MSLPLPYGKKRSGVEREPPPAGGPRPYAERLAQVPELVEKVGPSRNTVVSALPGAAAILMVCGAVAPIAAAHPAIRSALFAPLVEATDPLSAGLTFAADAVWSGWVVALILLSAAVLGYLLWTWEGTLERRRRDEGGPGARPRRALVLLGAAFGALVIGFLIGSFGFKQGDLGQGALAAWVVVTAALAAYGARSAQSRSNYLGSVGGAVALLLGGRLIFGTVALLFLALSDKEFPGQHVDRFSWRRSQVAPGPIRAPVGPTYRDEDWGSLHRSRWSWPSAPPLAGFLLLIGALVPFGYWEPFRAVFFGALVQGLMPATTFVPIVSDAFWSLDPVVSSYILVMSLVSLGGARFAFGARRPAAVIAGAVALLASGRVITGLAVLVILLFSYAEYGHDEAAPGSGPAGDPADAGSSAH